MAHVVVHVTGRCNNHCPYCYEPRMADGDLHKRLELLDRILTDLEGFQVTVALTGGEPTLTPSALRSFLELIFQHKEIGLSNLNTNGSHLEECLDMLREYPPTWVNISKHTLGDEDGFITWDGLQNILPQLKSLVRLNCTLQRGKIDSPQKVELYFSQAAKLSVPAIQFFQLYKDSRKMPDYQFLIVSYKDVVPQAWGYGNEHTGWQCRCRVHRRQGMVVAFKAGDSDLIARRETYEMASDVNVARQIVILPTGKWVTRYCEYENCES